MTLSGAELLGLHSVIEPNGTLIVAEAGRQVPFEIVRIFAVTAVGVNECRGHHAHKKLSQLLVCLSGKVEVTVDDGRERRMVVLDHPAQALHLPPGIWAEQVYEGPGTVLLVLCDRPYEEEDYIRDYDDFIAYRTETGSAT
jgi:dTDP-4-dehydrorhamnose 3,5-epimerase-like enzyme